MSKLKCIEYFNCKKVQCPVYKKSNKECWFLKEVFHKDKIPFEYIEKMESCLRCEYFNKCIKVESITKVLKRLFKQIKRFQLELLRNDRKIKSINEELSQSLKDVFGALKRISSGDPNVRISVRSKIKSIRELKKMVNMTARNIAEIVNQSHEFAITLAEYFDVLHKVSAGDLNVRIKGRSKIELLEALKKVTNEMIEKISIEIAERKKAEDALRRLSIIDDLTGIYNRRGFFTLAQQQIKMADRMKKKIYLLYSDLDGLKWINDKYGHNEGDVALIEIANILKRTFRESDVIARLSGDEFAVLAMETKKTNPEMLIERLYKNIEAHNLKRGTDYSLSLSTGFSIYDPDNPASVEELLAIADKDMYKNKLSKKEVFYS